MNRKIWKALGIAVCMLALAAPRAMAETHVHMVTADTNFAKVVKSINASKDEGEHVIELYNDITLTDNYTLTNGKTTTIKGENHRIFIKGSNAGITVTGEKTTLNLGANGYDGTLTIDGDTGVAFITVSGGATANMYGNVTLQNRGFAGNACVVIKGLKLVTGPDSAFNMYGGVIENCSRAVIAYSGATFYMRSGEIKNCKVNGDGVISVTDNSKFIMEGGIISGCKADTGGGLYADNSAVTINKGTISECSADKGGGLYAKNSSTVTISGGTISGCTAVDSGGGLYADKSTINISGGTISGCDGRWGGGLYADNSTITINGGTISECSAGTGGGLYAINQSTLNISGGTIENNRAAYGGGVALIGSTINPITHWTVDGNKADNTGGGIYLENVLMDVSDGSNHIYNNTADGHGADIFLYNGSSAIRLPNAADMNVPYHNSGINIDGWYKDDNPRYKPSEDGKAVDAGVELNGGTPDGRGLSLVASYKTKCTVTINANGGAGGSGSQTVHKGMTVTLEAPTKKGHLFKGWKDEEKGNSYPAGEDGKVKITVTGDMTLTAVWEARSFTVTYVLLNGETRTETAAYGKTVTLGEEPRTGYTFVGWKDSEKVYHAGETITVTEDKTLTAVWEARTFTVTYVLLDGKTRTETAAYGQNVTLGEEPRTGYTFVGWNDGEKVHHAGETITVTENKTLTAEWKKLPSAENLPKTGDESPVLLWGAALAVSAAACFVLRRKK